MSNTADTVHTMVGDDEHPDDDADWARQRIVEIDDELRATPPEDFARRHALQSAADGFRQIMRSGHRDALSHARLVWEARAGRKGTHEVDTEAIKGMVRSMMPSAGR